MKLNKILLSCTFFIALGSSESAALGNINIENPLNGFPGLEELDPFTQITWKSPAEFKEIYSEIIFLKVAKQLVLNGDEAVIDKNNIWKNFYLLRVFTQLAFKISNEEIIQSIKMEWSSGELNGTIMPSGILMKRAEEFPKKIEFQNYFSQLKFSETGGLKPGGRLYFSHMSEEKVKDNDLQIALTPVGLSKEWDEVDYSKNSIKKEDESVIQLFGTMFLYHLIERTV